MELQVKRHWFTEKTSIGILKVNDTWFSFTLEDALRAEGVKVAGATCVDAGYYRLVLDYSNRFQCVMPHILDVPRFLGVRIHAGNKAEDTEGCILLGLERDPLHQPDRILRSRDAFNALMVLLKAAADKGEEIWLTITNEPL
jgi:hypothetical protein